MTELFAPAAYWSLIDKSPYCNGCGAKGLGGYLIPDNLFGLSIENCCNIHDFMYSMGNGIADKEEADRVFLNNMLREIEAVQASRVVNFFRRLRAMGYYSAVRDFGGPAFWAGKNRPEELGC